MKLSLILYIILALLTFSNVGKTENYNISFFLLHLFIYLHFINFTLINDQSKNFKSFPTMSSHNFENNKNKFYWFTMNFKLGVICFLINLILSNTTTLIIQCLSLIVLLIQSFLFNKSEEEV